MDDPLSDGCKHNSKPIVMLLFVHRKLFALYLIYKLFLQPLTQQKKYMFLQV